MKSTPDGTYDNCKKCGKIIRYDKSDGYWDNHSGVKNGSSVWTPFNCVGGDEPHEPSSHERDSKGYYHPIKKGLLK